jgi:ribosomal-protein-alanine N-acetyltransferase
MSDINIKLYTAYDRLPNIDSIKVVRFLHTHLEEYRDEKQDIKMAMAYAMKEIPSPGGFVLVATKEKNIVGAVVVNKTEMQGYIPENVLVYVAVHKNYEKRGLVEKLVQRALKICNGDVALHLEPNNPAKQLYEKIGFENKYLEMRYYKSKPTN